MWLLLNTVKMSVGCGSVASEQSDPVSLQSPIMTRWSGLNSQHLFSRRPATRVGVAQRERRAAAYTRDRASVKLWVSPASQESTSNKTIDFQRLQCSTGGALCLVSFICLCLSWDEAQPINMLLWDGIQWYIHTLVQMVIIYTVDYVCNVVS